MNCLSITRLLLLATVCLLTSGQIAQSSPGKRTTVLPIDHHTEHPECSCLQPVESGILVLMTNVDNLSQQADPQLVEAIQLRSQSAAHEATGTQAFTVLYKRHAGHLLAFLKTRLKDMPTTQEVAQETWARVWEKCETHFDGRHFRGWLYQIARNLMHDRLRIKAPSELSSFSIPTVNDDTTYWESVSDQVDELKTCITELNEEQQRVVMARLEGHSYEKISEDQEIASKTAQTRFHRAKQSLKECMTQKGLTNGEEA